jgi:hypothetical protein
MKERSFPEQKKLRPRGALALHLLLL